MEDKTILFVDVFNDHGDKIDRRLETELLACILADYNEIHPFSANKITKEQTVRQD